jgi:hypothetical protein
MMEKQSVILSIDNPNEFFANLTEYDNLILNMMSGLEPEDLSESEIEMLKEKHGEEWKIALGYEK